MKRKKDRTFEYWFWGIAIIIFIFIIGYKFGLHRVIGFMNG
jgi:predicted transporter